VSEPTADLPWTPGRRSSPTYVDWPPKGKRLSVRFAPPAGSPAKLQALNVTLVYELYDGAPMLSKWLDISAPPSAAPVLVDAVTTELLALNCDHSDSSKAGAARFESLLTAAHGAAAAWTTSANTTNDPGACEPIFSASYSGPPPPPHGPDLREQPLGAAAPPAPPEPPSPPVAVPAAGPAVTIGGSDPISTSHFASFRTVRRKRSPRVRIPVWTRRPPANARCWERRLSCCTTRSTRPG